MIQRKNYSTKRKNEKYSLLSLIVYTKIVLHMIVNIITYFPFLARLRVCNKRFSVQLILNVCPSTREIKKKCIFYLHVIQ